MRVQCAALFATRAEQMSSYEFLKDDLIRKPGTQEANAIEGRKVTIRRFSPPISTDRQDCLNQEKGTQEPAFRLP